MEVTIRIKKEDEKHLITAANLAGIKVSQDGKNLVDEERYYKIKTNLQNMFDLGILIGLIKSLDEIRK